MSLNRTLCVRLKFASETTRFAAITDIVYTSGGSQDSGIGRHMIAHRHFLVKNFWRANKSCRFPVLSTSFVHSYTTYPPQLFKGFAQIPQPIPAWIWFRGPLASPRSYANVAYCTSGTSVLIVQFKLFNVNRRISLVMPAAVGAELTNRHPSNLIRQKKNCQF